MIIAVDPGRQKCGVAVLDDKAQVIEKEIVNRDNLFEAIYGLSQKYKTETIVIGQGTGSYLIKNELLKIEPRKNIVFIKEENSTLEARKKYWAANPPRGLLAFIPTALLPPPVPIDDYAAVILGERHLKG